MKILLTLLLTLAFVRDDPPPAVVRICGIDGNGVTVPREVADAWALSLEAQGCFPEHIYKIDLSKEWVFVYGHRVLIGE